jgi:hypothetical protein
MPTIYAILGDANTRKSSTTRSLTGVARRKCITVETAAGNLEVFVQISSLQESKIMPDDFVTEMTSGGYENILVTLWISQRVTSDGVYPRGVDYLQALIAAGWTIGHIVVLGAPILSDVPAGTPSPRFVPNSRTTPVNQIAAQVRGWWGWV